MQFVAGSEGYIGFKLDGVNYGWMRVIFTNNTGGAVVKDWAYDNSGSALVTGNVLQSAVSGGAQTVTLTSASGSFTLGTAITDALLVFLAFSRGKLFFIFSPPIPQRSASPK